MHYVEPRRECCAIVAVNESEGYYRVCGGHVEHTLIAGVYRCGLCGAYARRGCTKEVVHATRTREHYPV